MDTKDFKYIEKYAEEHNIELMEKGSIKFITKYIMDNNIKNILEIGTSIGYLTIKMALCNSNIKITTVEKDCNKYVEALKNIKNFELEKQITLVLADALELKTEAKYDLIIIDIAKGDYIDLFEKYSNNLNINGIIISNNLNYNNIMNKDIESVDDNTRKMIDKIEEYVEYLVSNNNFKTKFYKIDDGLSVSKKLENDLPVN